MDKIFKIVSFTLASFLFTSCSSSQEASQRTNRAGRPYQEVRGMSDHKVDSSTLYDTCLKERTAAYCNNRLGR